jgi:hypothetical protein
MNRTHSILAFLYAIGQIVSGVGSDKNISSDCRPEADSMLRKFKELIIIFANCSYYLHEYIKKQHCYH